METGLTIHQIGMYSTAQGPKYGIYMVEHQGGNRDAAGEVPAAVTYCLDINERTEFLMWPDWLQFAHAVNAKAGEVFLDPLEDPAEELGLLVPTGWACPDCGCRVVDALLILADTDHLPIELEEDDVLCDFCGETYQI